MRIPALAAVATLLASPFSAAAESVVAARILPAGTVLAEADLMLVDAEIPGAHTTVEAVVGLQTKEAIYPGRPILTAKIGPPVLVERNDAVTLVYSAAALTILAEGRALATGAEGETVRALNLASKVTVSGTVDSAGRIRVGGTP